MILAVSLAATAAGVAQAPVTDGAKPLPEAPATGLSDLPANMDRAKAALATGDLETAEVEARAGAAASPSSADALYLLGEVLMRRNKAAESLGVMTRAAALRRPTGQQLRLVGLDYVLIDDIPDALRWLTEAARASPKDPEIWYSLGRTQYTKGTFADAEASFERALVFNPKSVKTEDNLGLALAAQNRNDEALAAYTRAIEKSPAKPSSEQPWLNRGTLSLHLGKADVALPDLMRATEIAPKCAGCHEAAGQALVALEKLPEARAQMEQATALEPENPRYHYELGQLYKRLGETKLSAEELGKSQKMYGTKSTPVQ